MAKTHDITIDQGADFVLPITLNSNDQRVTLNHEVGAAGTWRLTHRGISTAGISIDAVAAQVQNALALIPEIGSDVNLDGDDGGPYDVHWAGDLAGVKQPLLSGTAAFAPPGTISVDNIPIDVTGYTGQFRIWESREAMQNGDAALLEITQTSSDDGVITFEADGKVTVKVEDAATQTLAFTNPAYYNLLLDNGSDLKTRYLEGKVIRN